MSEDLLLATCLCRQDRSERVQPPYLLSEGLERALVAISDAFAPLRMLIQCFSGECDVPRDCHGGTDEVDQLDCGYPVGDVVAIPRGNRVQGSAGSRLDVSLARLSNQLTRPPIQLPSRSGRL